MRRGALLRVFLAAVLLAAMQLALVHPLEHLSESSPQAGLHDDHPFEPTHAQQCDLCASAASFFAAAPSAAALQAEIAAREFAVVAREHRFHAVFTPVFRSQAPPRLS